MRLIALIDDPGAVRRILEHLDPPSSVPLDGRGDPNR